MYFSKIKRTAGRISSHVCSDKYPITCPAVLKRKLTIAPISPGSVEAAFAPTALRPFAKFLPRVFRALVIVPTTAPIVMLAARNITVIFFEDLTDPFSERHSSFSFRDLCLQLQKFFFSIRHPFFRSFFIKF